MVMDISDLIREEQPIRKLEKRKANTKEKTKQGQRTQSSNGLKNTNTHIHV
jgi:hypothetical protein